MQHMNVTADHIPNEKLASGCESSRKEGTARLMETATRMMKNGATPDVIVFIEATISEINDDVLVAIQDEHDRDQQLIDGLITRFGASVDAMEECRDELEQEHVGRAAANEEHKVCRSSEAIACARSRKCEEELEVAWGLVKSAENDIRDCHAEIHGEWCVASELPVPLHPDLEDPFRDPWMWTESFSQPPYPEIDLTRDHFVGPPDNPIEVSGQFEFRRWSVTTFERYISLRPIVEEAWRNYNAKLSECANLEEVWEQQVDACDELQTAVRTEACGHAAGNRQCASDFGHEYEMTMAVYSNATGTIRDLEEDRMREWETLRIVTCLMETTYTHVIHAIETGEDCITLESHPQQTEREIENCHLVNESMTTHLRINYGTPPDPPALPPAVEPPCTAQYIWDDHGSFHAQLQSNHSNTIRTEGLESYFTVLSAHGWAGCAAPKACIPCESEELVVDPNYTAHCSGEVIHGVVETAGAEAERHQLNDVYLHHEICATCKQHHAHLNLGEMDLDTFKCLSGDQCIRAVGRCNGHSECDDGSDELGCHGRAEWGKAAVLGVQVCQDPFVSDVQFRCDNGECIDIAGKCNGVDNCADDSDERDCTSDTTGVTLEAMDGLMATIQMVVPNSQVFYDRSYTFSSLGDLAEHSFIKMSNDDKRISNEKVQIKLRLPQPMTVYLSKLEESALPWLQAEGWTETQLAGPTYHGERETPHTDWSGVIVSHTYGPGQVWQKTFPAGTVELRGNGGGAGSYLLFVDRPTFRYHYGTPAGNTCPTTDVSEAECLAAVQHLLPRGQAQGRTNLVAGSWGWVPPGCSVQSHFTHGRDGDWAAHYNRNSGGQNDGGYTPVCETGTPVYSTGQAHANTKCPHNHGDRLFRNPEQASNAITLDQCYAQCATTVGCNHFSWGTWNGGHVCMGCTSLANAETHSGFMAYNMIQ